MAWSVWSSGLDPKMFPQTYVKSGPLLICWLCTHCSTTPWVHQWPSFVCIISNLCSCIRNDYIETEQKTVTFWSSDTTSVLVASWATTAQNTHRCRAQQLRLLVVTPVHLTHKKLVSIANCKNLRVIPLPHPGLIWVVSVYPAAPCNSVFSL